MTLSIQHKRLRHTVVALLHECHLHLILYILDLYPLMDIQMTENLRYTSKIYLYIHRLECLDNSIHNLIQREAFYLSVTLGDSETFYFHCFTVLENFSFSFSEKVYRNYLLLGLSLLTPSTILVNFASAKIQLFIYSTSSFPTFFSLFFFIYT